MGEQNLRIRETDVVQWLRHHASTKTNQEYTMSVDQYKAQKELIEDELEHRRETESIKRDEIRRRSLEPKLINRDEKKIIVMVKACFSNI